MSIMEPLPWFSCNNNFGEAYFSKLNLPKKLNCIEFFSVEAIVDSLGNEIWSVVYECKNPIGVKKFNIILDSYSKLLKEVAVVKKGFYNFGTRITFHVEKLEEDSEGEDNSKEEETTDFEQDDEEEIPPSDGVEKDAETESAKQKTEQDEKQQNLTQADQVKLMEDPSIIIKVQRFIVFYDKNQKLYYKDENYSSNIFWLRQQKLPTSPTALKELIYAAYKNCGMSNAKADEDLLSLGTKIQVEFYSKLKKEVGLLMKESSYNIGNSFYDLAKEYYEEQSSTFTSFFD